ncbi:hypothetical protein TIFTF001_036833 [Ficus carica]|uniref:Uncharacterized protein n=1 Tax=Ficus carica TaxID=3494 RepID=A0AA88E523_FICCA|nr:hypothetical protein TIFTF001_036833 [Ficus carica]
MSDISDSENAGLSESLDITGSEASSSRTRSSSVGEVMGPEGRTPDHMSGISDIPSPGDQVSPANRELSGAARLEKIPRVGPGTAPDHRLVEELGGSFQAPTAPVVDLTVEGGEAAERSAGQASTTGREGESVSDSTDPSGEDTEARDRPASRGIPINDVKVCRRSDAEMSRLAAGRPVYTADYYTTAVTQRYLVALRREFNIPENVDLLVPGADDLPSRPPSGYIALSAEYFRAGLRLPFHAFLRQALTRLNVAPAQLNANAYRALISCYALWAAKFARKMPFTAFQNLYRMKSAPSAKGFYYFQGFKGTFITGCPDSDKQFKHLWFYAGGAWLHEHLSYFELPESERVPVAFRRGHVWTRAPHATELTLERIDALRELSDPERSQHGLLSEASLSRLWVGSSSTYGRSDDQPRTSPAVTVAEMPPPAVHYSSRTARPADATTDDRSGVPQGVPKALVHGSSSGDPSPGTWGPRVADEDVDLVIRDLYPTRGLRIEEPMADRDRRGTKRPSVEESLARLQKNARLAKGKGKEVTARQEARPDRPREDRPREDRPREDRPREERSRADRSRDERPAGRQDARPSRPRDEPSSSDSSIRRVLVMKFEEHLTVEMAESSRRSDHIEAITECATRLIGDLCLLFSGSVAARAHANRTADELKAAEADIRALRRSEKEAKAAAEEAKRAAEEKAKAAEELAKRADDKLRRAEDWVASVERKAEEAETSRLEMQAALRKAEEDLGSARASHQRYLEVALPAALEDAKATALAEYLESEDFRARLVAEYNDGMRDMKAGFIATNPTLVEVDWSFVPDWSDQTMAEEAAEVGEVTGEARLPEQPPSGAPEPAEQEQPLPLEQPVADLPSSPLMNVSMSDLFPEQLD